MQDTEARPVIRLSHRGSSLHLDVGSAVGVLGLDRDIYQRDGELVRVVHHAEVDVKDGSVAIGTPVIRPIPSSIMAAKLTKLARWQKWDSRLNNRQGGWADCSPPGQVVGALLAREEWPSVRPIVGVTETPILRSDGSVMQSPGYDEATGFLYSPNVEFPEVPETPSRDDAVKALGELHEVWSEMEWAGKPHSYVPVAAALTMLARPSIHGAVPGFGFDASVRGAGKTLAASCVGIIAQGRSPAVITWPEKEEELEKTLGALTIQGAQVALFDNLEGPFGGPAIDKVLSCEDRVALRVLGKSEVPSLSWRAMVMATGNNLQLRRDIVRRLIVARQEPSTERPEERTGFRHDPLTEWVATERPRLVAAGLTVLRAYLAAGAPDQKLARMGTFESWAALVPSAIVWAAGADIMECRPSRDGGDEEAELLGALLNGWERLDSEGAGLTVKSALDLLYTEDYVRGDAPPDGFEDLRDTLEALAPIRRGNRPDPHRLGYAIRRYRGRVMGGRCLDAIKARAGRKAWTVRRVS